VPSKLIDPVPNLATLVLTCALPTVIKLFLLALSKIPALVPLRSNEVLVIAVSGAVGGVKLAV
jgi:hypothetical protein